LLDERSLDEQNGSNKPSTEKQMNGNWSPKRALTPPWCHSKTGHLQGFMGAAGFEPATSRV
jgi:hypothetical protein